MEELIIAGMMMVNTALQRKQFESEIIRRLEEIDAFKPLSPGHCETPG